MSRLMCRLVDSFSPYKMARIASKCGLKRTATKIMEHNFGKQIGKTSESGLRGFYGRWSDGSNRIEVVDKNFQRRSNTIVRRNENGILTSTERFLFNNDKTIHTIMIKSLNPVNLYGKVKHDVKYTHFIEEYGNNIEQRIGKWQLSLPEGKKIIERNEKNILDKII